MLIGLCLSQAVAGLPDQGRQIQFKNETRRIEFRLVPLRLLAGIPLGGAGITRRDSAFRACHPSRICACGLSRQGPIQLLLNRFKAMNCRDFTEGNMPRSLARIKHVAASNHHLPPRATCINLQFTQLRRICADWGIRRGHSMSCDMSQYAARDADRARLHRARALLDMFEEDRGRRAISTDELREWIAGRNIGQLRIRMNRRLYGIVVR